MKLRVKDNALDHAGKFEYFTIEPPVACYEPYLNRNSLETSPFIYKLLAITDTFKKFSLQYQENIIYSKSPLSFRISSRENVQNFKFFF